MNFLYHCLILSTFYSRPSSTIHFLLFEKFSVEKNKVCITSNLYSICIHFYFI